MTDKEQKILEYLYTEGFATKKMIIGYLQSTGGKGTSATNLQSVLRKLSDKNFIAHKKFYEENNCKHIYHLEKEGLKQLGLERTEITAFKKKIQRIPIQHIEHYFLVRQLEKILHLYVDQTEYLLESCNEFNHDGRLSVKDCNFRSDGEMRIFHKSHEMISLRVEMDTGKESIIKQIRDKFDSYAKYLKSSRIDKEYRTWPLYILFVTPKTHIDAVVGKLGKHAIMPYILFMPLERLQSFTLDTKLLQFLTLECPTK